MTRTILIFALTFLVVLSGCSGKPSMALGKPIPLTSFQMLSGEYRVSSELRGKPSVVMFWASWCPHSRSALTALSEYAREHALAGKVNFLAQSVDPPSYVQAVSKIATSGQYNPFEIGFSGNQILDQSYQAFDANDLPDIYFIDAAGNVTEESHRVSPIIRAIEADLVKNKVKSSK